MATKLRSKLFFTLLTDSWTDIFSKTDQNC